MPRSPKDNKEIRNARREEILAAATRVFAEKGFAQTKISEIAAAAGFSHGLVYHYFESKDAIFGAIADQMMARIANDLDLEATRAYDRLVLSMERSYARIGQKVDANAVVLQAVLQGTIPPAVRDTLMAHFRRVHRKLVSLIAEAQRDGDVDPNASAEELASALVCMFRGMSIRAPGVELPFELPQPQTILRILRAPAVESSRQRASQSRRGSSHVKHARRSR